jgi:hypothetical protein
MDSHLRSRRRRLRLILPLFSIIAVACTCTSLFSPGELLGGLLPEEVEEAREQVEATLDSLTEGEEPTATPAAPTTEAMDTPTQTAQPAGEGGDGSSLTAALSEGRVGLVGIAANTGGQTQGSILTVELTNPESQEVVVEIPCGLIFAPETAADEQRLMSIQPASAMVPADGAASVEPYVICIDSGRATPSLGTSYQVGEIASGDLLKLAECLCGEDLTATGDAEPGFGNLGVQFAVWSVSSGTDFEELLSGAAAGEGALGDILGEQGEELFGLLQDMFLAPAQEWLDRCGIEVEGQGE